MKGCQHHRNWKRKVGIRAKGNPEKNFYELKKQQIWKYTVWWFFCFFFFPCFYFSLQNTVTQQKFMKVEISANSMLASFSLTDVTSKLIRSRTGAVHIHTLLTKVLSWSFAKIPKHVTQGPPSSSLGQNSVQVLC